MSFVAASPHSSIGLATDGSWEGNSNNRRQFAELIRTITLPPLPYCIRPSASIAPITSRA